VLGDLDVDLESEGEGGASVFSGNARRGAGAYGVQKRFDLQDEGFFGLNRQLAQREAGGGVRAGFRGCDNSQLRGSEGRGSGDVDEEKLLVREIDGEVLARLKEAQLADLFGTDAAGGEVGDAAVGELEADVGDVGLVREDGKADGADVCDWRVDEAEYDIEIVDHEVEHDIDVERAGGEDAEAMRLKEHGLLEKRKSGGDGGVEALQVTHLQDAAMGRGGFEKRIGIGERSGDGFFDEEIDAGGEEATAYAAVVDGGDAERGGGDVEVGREHVVDAGESGDPVLGGDGRSCGGIRVNDRNKDHGAGGFEAAIDTEMVAAEGARTNDGDA